MNSGCVHEDHIRLYFSFEVQLEDLRTLSHPSWSCSLPSVPFSLLPRPQLATRLLGIVCSHQFPDANSLDYCSLSDANTHGSCVKTLSLYVTSFCSQSISFLVPCLSVSGFGGMPCRAHSIWRILTLFLGLYDLIPSSPLRWFRD